MDKNFVSTEADIRSLTQDYVQAHLSADGSRLTYLRALIATTQKELGGEPRANNAPKRGALGDEARAKQLAALASVHARFYPVVIEVVEASLDGIAAKDRAKELNRRTNFARTALYAARLYVRAGKDLTGVAAGKVTKSALTVVLAPSVPSARRLKTRVERASKAFITSLLALGESDQEGARAELDTLLGVMANQLAALGAKPARDLQHAVEEHRPFRSGSTLFVPTATTILRQRASPS